MKHLPRTARVALGVSAVLHLLLLLIPPGKDEIQTVQRYQLSRIPSASWIELLRARRPELTVDGMERLPGPAFVAPQLPLDSAPPADLPDVGGPELTRTDSLWLAARAGKTPWRPIESAILDLNQLALESAARKAEERYKYARIWMPDADTTDAASRLRRRAEEIVDRAIRAMGGLERLRSIQDKKVAVTVFRERPIPGWFPAGERFYLRGRRYLERQGSRSASGFDGHSSWHQYYGVAMAAADLRYLAERWDFLSQFRGREIRLEYLGERMYRGRAVEMVAVEDLKYGVQRVAYFRVSDHLLVYLTDGRTRLSYEEYRPVDGILTPYELVIDTERFRHETTYNLGLDAAFFDTPGTRTWDAAMVDMVLHSFWPVGTGDSAATQVYLPEIDLKTGPGSRKVRDESLHLLNAYVVEKLRLSGVLTEQKSAATHSATVEIREFHTVGSWPYEVSTVRLAVAVQSRRDPAALFEKELTYRWEGISIDGHVADQLTFLMLYHIGQGLGTM